MKIRTTFILITTSTTVAFATPPAVGERAAQEDARGEDIAEIASILEGLERGEPQEDLAEAVRVGGRLPKDHSLAYDRTKDVCPSNGRSHRELFLPLPQGTSEIKTKKVSGLSAVPEYKIFTEIIAKNTNPSEPSLLKFTPSVDFKGWRSSFDPTANYPSEQFGVVALGAGQRKSITLEATATFTARAIMLKSGTGNAVAFDNAESLLDCAEPKVSDKVDGVLAYATIVLAPKDPEGVLRFTAGQELMRFNIEEQPAVSKWRAVSDKFIGLVNASVIKDIATFTSSRMLYPQPSTLQIASPTEMSPAGDEPRRLTADLEQHEMLVAHLYIYGPGTITVTAYVGQGRVIVGSTQGFDLDSFDDGNSYATYTLSCGNSLCDGFAYTEIVGSGAVAWLDPAITVTGSGATGYIKFETIGTSSVLYTSPGLNHANYNDALWYWGDAGSYSATTDVPTPPNVVPTVDPFI